MGIGGNQYGSVHGKLWRERGCERCLSLARAKGSCPLVRKVTYGGTDHPPCPSLLLDSLPVSFSLLPSSLPRPSLLFIFSSSFCFSVSFSPQGSNPDENLERADRNLRGGSGKLKNYAGIWATCFLAKMRDNRISR